MLKTIIDKCKILLLCLAFFALDQGVMIAALLLDRAGYSSIFSMVLALLVATFFIFYTYKKGLLAFKGINPMGWIMLSLR